MSNSATGSPERLKLSCAFIRKAKVYLDAADLALALDVAVQTFGCFLRYNVNEKPPAPRPLVDAFQLMMSSQRLWGRSRGGAWGPVSRYILTPQYFNQEDNLS